MAGFWRTATAYGLGLAATLGLASWALGPDPKDFAGRTYHELYASDRPARCLVWGTSRTSCGVDPRALERPGLDVYNFALSGTNPVFLRELYRETLAHYARPDVVLLGLDARFLTRFSFSRRFEQDSAYWPTAVWAGRMLEPATDHATAFFQRWVLVRRRAELQEAVAGLRSEWNVDPAQAYRGYVPLVQRHALVPWVLGDGEDPAFAAAFVALLQDLRRDHVRVVCFQPPDFALPGVDVRGPNARLAGIVKAFGLPFLNYNEELASDLNHDASMYADAAHLCEAGAQRFSLRLAGDLRARRLL